MKTTHIPTTPTPRPAKGAAWIALVALAAGGAAVSKPDTSTPADGAKGEPTTARHEGESAGDRAHVRARLLASTPKAAPSQQIELALELTIDRGWHVYWDGLNDTGFPPQIEFEPLPEGWTAPETVRWMAPKRHVAAGGILDHIYEDRVVLLMPMTIPADAKPGVVTIRAKADWLVCQEACIPEESGVETGLEVVPQAQGSSESAPPEPISWARARLPKPWSRAVELGAKAKPEATSATIEFPGAASLAFFPSAESEGIANLIENGSAKGARLVLPFEEADGRDDALLEGILEVTSPAGGVSWFEVRVDLPARRAPGSR